MLAFMFETRQVFETRQALVPTQHAMTMPQLQPDDDSVWDGLRKMFTGGHA